MKYRNNPLNIPFVLAHSRWRGLQSHVDGICIFDSLSNGYRAAWILMRRLRDAGKMSLIDIVISFAPVGMRDSFNYLRFVADKMRLFPWDDLSCDYDYVRLVYYMAWYEQGTLDGLFSLRQLCDLKSKCGITICHEHR